jgi:predicted RNA-binding Zn-ribbon protein involved in translation (DUF1610 family)
MSQVVKGTCPACGNVSLAPGDIAVTINKLSAEGPTYSFTCPECGEVVTKPATDEVQYLLKTAIGVRWNVIHVPAELTEPRGDGPPLTADDVDDFIISLGLTPANLISVLAGGDK